MRFIIDSMFPPEVCERLRRLGHEAVSPKDLGGHNLPDSALVQIAIDQGFVIVTENARDFAPVPDCSVILVRKSWWPVNRLAAGLATAVDRWASSNPEPGHWAHWLDAEFR